MNIYLRPLEEKDALISYKWRNNPHIWSFTGSSPDRTITPEIETEWIREALQRHDEARYAICIEETDEYIGNVQLTHISDRVAEFHIFIGEEKYWGKMIGTAATRKMIETGLTDLGLKQIYLYVHKNNIAAIKAYLNAGFVVEDCAGSQLKMVVRNVD